MLYFITGNKNKFAEVRSLLPEVEQLDIGLTEIQGMDSRAIIEAKLFEARKQHNGEFIVEDMSMEIDCLNGFPGPLIKWFATTLTNRGVANVVGKMDDSNACAKVTIGYSHGDKVEFFEGVIDGTIVHPRGGNGFGWDEIFQPNGSDKTFAEMTDQEKEAASMRRMAVDKLKDFLTK